MRVVLQRDGSVQVIAGVVGEAADHGVAGIGLESLLACVPGQFEKTGGPDALETVARQGSPRIVERALSLVTEADVRGQPGRHRWGREQARQVARRRHVPEPVTIVAPPQPERIMALAVLFAVRRDQPVSIRNRGLRPDSHHQLARPEGGGLEVAGLAGQFIKPQESLPVGKLRMPETGVDRGGRLANFGINIEICSPPCLSQVRRVAGEGKTGREGIQPGRLRAGAAPGSRGLGVIRIPPG